MYVVHIAHHIIRKKKQHTKIARTSLHINIHRSAQRSTIIICETIFQFPCLTFLRYTFCSQLFKRKRSNREYTCVFFSSYLSFCTHSFIIYQERMNEFVNKKKKLLHQKSNEGRKIKIHSKEKSCNQQLENWSVHVRSKVSIVHKFFLFFFIYNYIMQIIYLQWNFDEKY